MVFFLEDTLFKNIRPCKFAFAVDLDFWETVECLAGFIRVNFHCGYILGSNLGLHAAYREKGFMVFVSRSR
jgi:hypothetical protein